MRFFTIYWRALRLLCPRCGGEKLFQNLFRMNEACSKCGLKYEREPGFFLGSIYFNYGLTSILVTIGYMTAFFMEVPRENTLWPLLVFVVLFPLWFFRYARSLWLGFDHFWDGSDPEKEK